MRRKKKKASSARNKIQEWGQEKHREGLRKKRKRNEDDAMGRDSAKRKKNAKKVHVRFWGLRVGQ